MAEDTMHERHTSLAGQSRRSMSSDQSQPQLDVTEHAPFLCAGDLRASGVLAYLADVVHKRRAKQQVTIQAGVQRAQLDRQRGNCHSVLQEPTEESMVRGR